MQSSFSHPCAVKEYALGAAPAAKELAMKLLDRLREIWSVHPGVEADALGSSLGAAEMDFDELAFQSGMDDSVFYSVPGIGTLDGLRQRIAGVHEDFPPGLMEQGNDDGVS